GQPSAPDQDSGALTAGRHPLVPSSACRHDASPDVFLGGYRGLVQTPLGWQGGCAHSGAPAKGWMTGWQYQEELPEIRALVLTVEAVVCVDERQDLRRHVVS